MPAINRSARRFISINKPPWGRVGRGHKFLKFFLSMKKEIKKDKKCLGCFSNNLRLEKWVFGNKKNRWIKRVKVICLDCNLRRAEKIVGELFSLTRKLRWRYKKKKGRFLEKEGYDYLILRNSTKPKINEM